jgi:ArsR family transcriptional regulator
MPHPCTAIVQSQNISAATVSHHLKELERAELITVERDGKFIHVSVNRDVLHGYAAHLRSL